MHLIMSYTSRMLRFTLALCIGLLFPAGAHAAVLSVETEQLVYGIGDTFIATIRVENDGECLNAAEVALEYPTDALRAVDFSRGDSIFSLWVAEPKLDTAAGQVSFSGGVPGGYCGRVQGDPAESNILGKAVFTVVGAPGKTARVSFMPSTRVYLHDGLGSAAELSFRAADITLEDAPTLVRNPWLDTVRADTIAPEPFGIEVRSDRTVFGGKYYIVFSTTDKQSGLDHYEIAEGGAWKQVTSPYVVKARALDDGLVVRAVDKAGNVRVADFDPHAIPPRQYTYAELVSYGLFFLIALVAILIRLHFARRDRPTA